MLDLGFEKEMNSCLDLIKTKCPAKFLNDDKEKKIKTFYSDEILINFVSATMNP